MADCGVSGRAYGTARAAAHAAMRTAGSAVRERRGRPRLRVGRRSLSSVGAIFVGERRCRGRINLSGELRVTAKTAGRETVRLPFRRASLFGAGGRRVTASGKKPAVPRRGGLQRLQRRVHRDVRKEPTPALGAFDPGRLRRKNQLVCKAGRPAGWPRAWLAATVTVAQARASAPGGPGVTPVPAPGGNRATLLPAMRAMLPAMLPAMRAAGPAPPGTQAECLQPGLGRRF